MNTVLVAIAVCGFVCLPCIKGQVVINLRNGNVTGSTDGVSWVSNLKRGTAGVTCSRQGVVKLTFAPGQRERAVITMTFSSNGSKEYTFNLGDSATNNAWAGDYSTQDNDAEVHSYGSTLLFWGRDNGTVSSGLLLSEPNFVGVTSNLTLEVKDQQVRAYNGKGVVHVRDNYLFQLKGQPDPRGVNYDLYLGMNRVVVDNSRKGVGLCRVSIQFFPS